MERSKRSKAPLTMRMKHEDDHGMNGDSNLNQTVCVHLNKENSQGTMTPADNKEERLRKTKDLQCMMTHALASTTLTDFPSVSDHFTRCWDFRSVPFLTCTRILCRESHCENGLVKCCLYMSSAPAKVEKTEQNAPVSQNCQ